MKLLRPAVSNTALSLVLFGACAFLLAFGNGNVDRVILRLLIELPLLLIVAAIMTFGINLIAALVAALLEGVIKGSSLVAVLVAALLAWGMASPPDFGGLGYHALLRPAFAIAIAIPWLASANLFALLGNRS